MSKKKIKELQDIKRKTISFQTQRKKENSKIKKDLSAGIAALKKDHSKATGTAKKKLESLIKKATKIAEEFTKSVLKENVFFRKTIASLEKDIKALQSV